nr:SRPBCC family protein [Kibdelosporangium sp. MJ126-NF4]CEL15148.1 Aha1 domain protein [Kibdelosporangium sp. MJ126-NF4]CTQ93256.1 Aha1 domain protein [Kibdelosporangium sp. MJ126-NF4]
MTDLIDQLNAVQRTVRKQGEGRAIALTQSYDAPIDDVWDACTSPERLTRWFAPVSGDLREGGKYAIEGNASGTVDSCDPPKTFALTWEFDGEVSGVDVRLTAEPNGRTRLELEHRFPVNEHWDLYGPGAGGVGWDLSLASLAAHLAEKPLPPEEEWTATPEAVDFIRGCSGRWGQAGIAGGEDPQWAQAAADRTTAAYTPPPTGGNDQR